MSTILHQIRSVLARGSRKLDPTQPLLRMYDNGVVIGGPEPQKISYDPINDEPLRHQKSLRGHNGIRESYEKITLQSTSSTESSFLLTFRVASFQLTYDNNPLLFIFTSLVCERIFSKSGLYEI